MESFDWAPTARNALRYLIGGALFNSPEIGAFLAADPYIVGLTALAIGGAVEWVYTRAKRLGWAT